MNIIVETGSRLAIGKHSRCLNGFLFVILWVRALPALAATAADEPWGFTHAGKPVERVTLENDRRMKVSFITYGASITSIEVPDREGRRQNIVLSLPDIAAYEGTQRKFASIIGRYAGRIDHAQFSLDGRTVNLAANSNGVALHSGPDGYDKRVWQREGFADSKSVGSVLHLVSDAGDQGFPGRLDVKVTYRLMRKANIFQIEYEATTDSPTIVNLTNHAYFNLAGAGTGGLASHTLQINADRYAETDARQIPTGRILSVSGTALDFRKTARPAARLASPDSLLGTPPGFDHSLLFLQSTHSLPLVAIIDDTASGRRMEISTTEPSVQFYSGNGFDGTDMGSEGRAYRRHDGFAFETQHLPDSPNHIDFPSTVLRPGHIYRSVTSFRFSVTPRR